MQKKKIVLLWKKIEVDTPSKEKKKKLCTWVKLNSDSNASTDESCEQNLPWNLLQTLKILYIYIIRENAVQLTYKERTSMNI